MKQGFLHTICSIQTVLALLVCLNLCVSCSRDTDPPGPQPGSGEVTIQFSLDIDNMHTRGIAEMGGNEGLISSLNLLIFHDDALYEQQAIAPGSTSFSVKTAKTNKDVTLWLIANSSRALSGSIALGGSKEKVRKAVTQAFAPGGTDKAAFPMWGESVVTGGLTADRTTLNAPIKLVRALARVDIQLSPTLTLPTGMSDFELVEAYIFQANDLIQVIPDAGAVDSDWKSILPSIPASAVADVTTEDSMVDASGKITGLYLPESLDAQAMIEENATCIIIQARYKKEGVERTGYYRLYFKNAQGYFPVLRNKYYKAAIEVVTGPGTTDPDGAVEMEVTMSVLEWEAEEIGGTEDYMSISDDHIDLFFYKNATGTVSVKSDLNLFDIRFCDANGNAITSPDDELIISSRFRVEIEDNRKTIRASALVNNESDDIYTEYVLVSSGNIEFMVAINQGTRKMRDYINIFNVTGLHGTLGDEVYNIHVELGLNAYGKGLQEILKHEANFGWNGIVPFEGYVISGLPYQTKLSPALLDLFQVVFMPAVSTLTPGSNAQEAVTGEEARNVIDWLRKKDDRVLVILSALNSNVNLLNELGITVNTYSPNFYSTYNFHPNAPQSIIHGPFGDLPASVSVAGPGQQSYINASLNPDITPILVNNANENHIIMGINQKERIVFFNSYWINTPQASAGVLTGNGLIRNDYDKLVANLWAWIAETVLRDEHDPDVTY